MRSSFLLSFVATLVGVNAIWLAFAMWPGQAMAQSSADGPSPAILALEQQLVDLQEELLVLSARFEAGESGLETSTGAGVDAESLAQFGAQIEILDARLSRLIERDTATRLRLEMLEQQIAAIEAGRVMPVITAPQPALDLELVENQDGVEGNVALVANEQVANEQEADQSAAQPQQNGDDEVQEAAASPDATSIVSLDEENAAVASDSVDGQATVEFTTVSAGLSAQALAIGALLQPGPVLPLVYEDDQGEIRRPIPQRRPGGEDEDEDEQDQASEDSQSAPTAEDSSPQEQVETEPVDQEGADTASESDAAAQSTEPSAEPVSEVDQEQEQETEAAAEAAKQEPVDPGVEAPVPDDLIVPVRRPVADDDAVPAAAPTEEQQQEVANGRPVQNAPSATVISEDALAQTAFDAAFDLYDRGDMPAAQSALEDFLSTYRLSPLASDASYWLGETFYEREMWAEAMRAFASSLRDYSGGRKAPESLLKFGITLGILGQVSEACRMLSFLPLEYVDAEPAVLELGQSAQVRLNCPN